MSAPLPLRMLTVRPICIPQYRNQRIYQDYGTWFLDNSALIADYYNSLKLYTEGEPLVDFFNFSKDQYTRELANVMARERLPHCGEGL